MFYANQNMKLTKIGSSMKISECKSNPCNPVQLQPWKPIECALSGLKAPLFACECCAGVYEYGEMFPLRLKGKQVCIDCNGFGSKMPPGSMPSVWGKATRLN